MTISKYLPPSTDIPDWASDTNYASGVDIGTPTKITPSAGQITQGWVPGTKPPSQWMNWLLNAMRAHQAANSGWYAHNWTQGVFIPGTFFDTLYMSVVHQTQIVTVQSAASGGLPVLCAVGTDGKTRRMYSELATDVSAADATIAASAVIGLGAAVFGGSPTLVACTAAGNMLKSTDLGSTWSTAGTPSVTGYPVYLPFASKWVVVHNGANRIKYTPDLSTWTDATGAGAAPNTPRKVGVGSTAAIVVYTGAQTVCARTTDAVNWTLPTLSAGTHDWRGVAYSSVRGAWMAVANDGVGALSLDNGLSWTALTIPSGAQDVICFGRWWISVCTNVHGGVGASIAVSEDNGTTWSEFMLDVDTGANAYDRLVEFDGRICAAGCDVNYRIQAAFSLRAPWMPTP